MGTSAPSPHRCAFQLRLGGGCTPRLVLFKSFSGLQQTAGHSRRCLLAQSALPRQSPHTHLSSRSAAGGSRATSASQAQECSTTPASHPTGFPPPHAFTRSRQQASARLSSRPCASTRTRAGRGFPFVGPLSEGPGIEVLLKFSTPHQGGERGPSTPARRRTPCLQAIRASPKVASQPGPRLMATFHTATAVFLYLPLPPRRVAHRLQSHLPSFPQLVASGLGLALALHSSHFGIPIILMS